MHHLQKVHIKRVPVFLLVAFAGLFPACEKDTIVHENLIIDGNTPPESNGVSTLQVNNYINNLYIDLYGRAPTDDELSEQSNLLKTSNYSDEARDEILSNMMSTYEYYKNINILTSQKMLVDVDSILIESQIALYEYIIYLNTLAGDTLLNFLFEYEVNKMESLKQAPSDLYAGSIGISEYFRRYIFNYFYDEVNMGSLNFVVSCFENLFGRLPTDDETSDGVLMVDGNSSQLFLIDGNSKENLIDIVTQCDEFYQGQVLEIYNTLLARSPTSYEMATYTLQMKEDDHFNEVKKIVLKSEEYAGF